MVCFTRYLCVALATAASTAARSSEDVLFGDDGKTVLYAYYRSDNFEFEEPLNTFPSVPARRVGWNWTFSIFDSPEEVSVVRYDVDVTADSVTIGGEGRYLSFLHGGAYLMTTSASVAVSGASSGGGVGSAAATASFGWSEVLFVNHGACVNVSLAPRAAEAGTTTTNATLLVVSSGAVDGDISGDDTSGCEPFAPLTMAELHNNPIDYVAASGACSAGLYNNHGASDYDNVDENIQPLAAHYHTRGSAYYAAQGSATFDAGVAGLQSGELRFVQQGFFYGPEVR